MTISKQGGVMLAFACVLSASCADYPKLRSVPSCEEIVFPASQTSEWRFWETEPPDQRIWFQNRKQGWIVTRKIGIWKTEDGGISWIRIPMADQVLDVFFENWTTVWLLTRSPEPGKQRIRLIHTSDSGANWSARIPLINSLRPSDIPLYLLSFHGDSGLICSSASVFYTNNRGKTWIESKLPGSYVTRPSRSQLSFVSPNHGWYLDRTKPAVLWETRDSGEIWTGAFRGEVDFKIQFIDDRRGFGLMTDAVLRPVLYSTETAGADWREMGVIPVERAAFARLQVCPGKTLFLSVYPHLAGSFWLSADLGDSWRDLYKSQDGEAIGFFLNPETGWILERADYRESLLGPFSRRIVHTENGGRDWTVLSTFEPQLGRWIAMLGSPPVRDREEPCPEQPGIFRVEDLAVALSAEEATSRLISCQPPLFPSLASRARVEGQVTLDIRVDRDGKVTCIWVDRGHVLLRDSAVDAARKWRFRPLQRGGKKRTFTARLAFYYSTSGRYPPSSPRCTRAVFQTDQATAP